MSSATSCLRESAAAAADLFKSVAAIALLDAALRSTAQVDSDGGEETRAVVVAGGTYGCGRVLVAGLEAVSSSAVLSAIESILRFRGGGEGEGTGDTPDTMPPLPEDTVVAASAAARSPSGVSGWLLQDGGWFAAPLRGMLDAPASLLARAIMATTTASPFVDTVATQRTRSPPEKPAGGTAAAAAAAAVATLSRQDIRARLCEQLGRGGSGELSPAGLACALRYAEGVLVAAATVEDVGSFFLGEESGGGGEPGGGGGGLLGAICVNVLERRHLQAVLEWPPKRGGGAAGVAEIVAAAVGAVQAPLASDASHHKALLRVQQAMHSQGLVGGLLVAARVLHGGDTASCGSDGDEARGASGAMGDGDAENGDDDDDDDVGTQREAALCACVELLSRLVLLSPHFSLQFLEGGGLGELVSAGSLRQTAPAPLAVGALVVFSQLARASAGNYDRLRAAGVDAGLGSLLAHADPAVRAKACNLVGNLCRHSGFFYPALQEGGPGGGLMNDGARGGEGSPPGRTRGAVRPSLTEQQQQQQHHHNHRQAEEERRQRHGGGAVQGKSIVDRLVDLCADPDPSARKFACFAVGNAAFHSDALYARLAPAVAPLVAALDDPEEKTRANAAGALGNLVRNGGSLSADLARRGGVGALLHLAARDPAPSPRRIALFSLGTCCAYTPCREALALVLEGKEDPVWEGGRAPARLLPAVPAPPPKDGWGGGGGGGRGGRQRWKNLVCADQGQGQDALPLPPAAPGIFPAAAAVAGAADGMVTPGLGLDRRLSQLEQAAVGVGDDVARKYVVRLRTKLSSPPQA